MRDVKSPDVVGHPRIVIVDDEPPMLELMEIMIRTWWKDATILTFGDPASALAELWRVNPDVLITDDTMPGLTGYDIIESLMDRHTDYPILMVSGLCEREKWAQQYAGCGLNITFFPKPFTAQQLKGWLTPHLGHAERP